MFCEIVFVVILENVLCMVFGIWFVCVWFIMYIRFSGVLFIKFWYLVRLCVFMVCLRCRWWVVGLYLQMFFGRVMQMLILLRLCVDGVVCFLIFGWLMLFVVYSNLFSCCSDSGVGLNVCMFFCLFSVVFNVLLLFSIGGVSVMVVVGVVWDVDCGSRCCIGL